MSDEKIILHLGLGSFHRAHQALYLQRLIETGHTGWRLAGGNIRADMSVVERQLIAQDGKYTLETVTPAGGRVYHTISAISKVIPWDEDLRGLIACGASPQCGIISFTVTEAGYYLASDNTLDTGFPALLDDVLHGTRQTIYGALAAILEARRLAGAGPVTLLSCDNLRSNGDRFHAGFREFLTRRGALDLRDWVENNTSSPNSMVDRITPRPSAETAARVRGAVGWADQCPVMAEDFIQWVIEDHFVAGRPAWERAGAEIVASVLPFEEAKIRVLNASHSAFAWAGTLKGYEFIHQGALDPEVVKIAHDYITNDVLPVLDPSPIDLPAYRDVVLQRFSNPHIQDTNQRVAADGFSKIPGFLAPTFQQRLAADEPIDSVAMLPALFLLFLQHWVAGKIPYAYQDQAMDEAAARQMLAATDPVKAFGEMPLLWGGLAGDARLQSALAAAYKRAVAWLGAV